jgi:hypothetical protein
MNDALQVPPPPKTKAKTTKGTPPTRVQTKQNLEKPNTGQLKDLNFKIEEDFIREFKQLALDEGKSGKQLLIDIFSYYRDNKSNA